MNRILSAVFSASLYLFSSTSVADDLTLKAGVFDPPSPAPDFTLRGSDGADLKLSRYRGKLVILEFGYTSCTEVCPITLAYLAAARKQLGAAGNDMQVVYVTVDPERDDPERLKKYLKSFDPSFIGGTGSSAQLAAVRNAYGVTATKVPLGEGLQGYTIHHSASIYLIDRAGRLRGLLPFGRTIDDIVHDAKILLRQ